MKLVTVKISPPPITSSLFGPIILFSTLLSDTLNQDSFE